MDRAKEKLELTGRRFGKLTVIAPAEEADEWLCRCQCGRERVVETSRLCDGSVTGCGREPCGLSSLTYVDSAYLGRSRQRLSAKTMPTVSPVDVLENTWRR